jgi:hypothetical protein
LLTTVDRIRDFLTGMAEKVPDEHEPLVTFFIQQRSAAVEQYCRRRFAKATYTAELHSGEYGQTMLRPFNWPIVVVTSVAIDGTTVAVGTDADDYATVKNTDGEIWALYREEGWQSEPHGIALTYDGGYVLPGAASPAVRNLPYDLEGAVVELVVGAYLQRGKAGLTRESFEGVSLDFDRWPAHILHVLQKFQRPLI